MRNNLANKIALDRLKQSCECVYFEGNRKYLTQECGKCKREKYLNKKASIQEDFKIKKPLTQEQKDKIHEEINNRFEPEFDDYLSVKIFVCEMYGIEIKDIY